MYTSIGKAYKSAIEVEEQREGNVGKESTEIAVICKSNHTQRDQNGKNATRKKPSQFLGCTQ